MSAQRFSSKIDGLFYSMSALAVGLPLVLAVLTFPEGSWRLGLGLAIALGAFQAALARSTYYVVDDQSLTVRCLFVNKRIPLASIASLRPSRNMMSAPALSLDRIEVSYTGSGLGFTLVSPKDKAAFIDAIRRAHPAATVASAEAGSRGSGWITATLAIAPLCIIGVMLYVNSRPSTVTVTPSGVTVGGTFGVSVPMRDITDVTLQDSMPKVVRKRMGSDGFALRGLFVLEGLGEGRIYVERSAHPYVLIRTLDSFVYINYPQSERTQALFDEITRARSSVH